MPHPIIKHSIPLTLIALLALLSWWLKDTASPIKSATDYNIRHDPDYFADNLVTTSMDESGNIHYQMAVEHIEHYPDDNSLLLVKPRIIFYQDQRPQWTISSAKGIATDKNEQVTFSQNVVVIQTGQDNITSMTMTTEELRIKPGLKLAETNSDVQFKGINESISATGMEADIGKNFIHLKSNVKSIFVSP